MDVKLEEIRIGDVLVVLPHEICPVDGLVIEGRGRMDEAYLTGEPYEIAKIAGSHVISGAINGDAALVIRAEKLAVDSRYARIMKVMQSTEQQRPRLRRLGDQLGAWYTPFALILAGIAGLVSRDMHRFLAVVVVATPCPLLLAIPTAIIGAISLAARRAIIIKNPAVLEQIDSCQTLIFDKTGTLTYGRPTLTEIICAEGFERQDVLRLAASLEHYSKHPLAGAIVGEAQKQDIKFLGVTELSEAPGEGLRGTVEGRTVRITGRKQAEQMRAVLPAMSGGLECVVFIDDRYAATMRFHDAPRRDSRLFIQHLKPRHGVRKVMLVSGDRESEVRYLASSVGISEVLCGKESGGESGDRETGNRQGEDAFRRRRHQRCAGIGGGNGGRGFWIAERHYYRGGGRSDPGNVAREDRRTVAHRAANAANRAAECAGRHAGEHRGDDFGRDGLLAADWGSDRAGGHRLIRGAKRRARGAADRRFAGLLSPLHEELDLRASQMLSVSVTVLTFQKP